MADFDPQQSSENEAGNQPDQYGESRSRNQRPVHPWDAQENNSHCGCGSDGESCDLGSGNRPDSFVADWSGAEKSLSEQASSFETRNAEMASEMTTPADEGLPSEFWGDLANSQRRAADAASSNPQQSGQLWDDLVQSQLPESGQTPEYAEEVGDSSSHYSVNSQPRGMGWSQDEASEWAPPSRDERMEAAGEPLDYETPALSRRDDFELATPASAQDDWQSVRSEAMHAENKSDSLTDSAADASQPQEKAKKARKIAARKPAKKKAAAKKTKAKKPAKKAAGKKAAKKKTAKKTVKKESTQPPTPPTAQDPTRQAA